jgi:phage baseplate assembly protein V
MGDTWDLNRVGVVAAVDYALARVKVHFEDLEHTSDWLPVAQQGAGAALQAYALPGVGDEVLCVYRSDGTEDGLVVGSYYVVGDPPPETGAGLWYVRFPDGSLMRWDNGALTIVANGDVGITGDVSITGGLSVSGAAQIGGGLSVGGDIHCGGKVYATGFELS